MDNAWTTRVKLFSFSCIVLVFAAVLLGAGRSGIFDFVRIIPGSLPSSGIDGELRVDSTDNNLKKFNESSSAWEEIAGGGGGSKNYFSDNNSDLESGTEDWAAYDDVSAFTDGTGGSPSGISIAVTTAAGEVLESDQSLKITKAASDSTDEGVSVVSDTVDREDYGDKLSCSLQIDADDANYTSGDLKLYAYDVTNSAQLTLVNDDSGDIPKKVGRVEFDVILDGTSGSETTSFRLALHVETDSATGSSWDVFVDSVKCGPTTVIKAPIGEYLGSLGSSVTNLSTNIQAEELHYWRTFDKMMVNGGLEFSGTNTEGEVVLTIPDSKSADTAKIFTDYTVTSEGDRVVVGTWKLVDESTPSGDTGGSVAYEVSSGNLVLHQDGNATAVDTSSNDPVTIADGDTISWWFEIPIQGWDAGNLISTKERSQSVKRVVLTMDSGQSHTSTGNWQDITGFTEDEDDFNLFDPSTGVFTCPDNDIYKVQGSVEFATNSTGKRALGVFDGTTRQSSASFDASSAGNIVLPFSQPINCMDGDTWSLQAFQSSGGNLNYNPNPKVIITQDPDFTDVGVFGEHDRVRSLLTSETSTSTADTYVDVTGSSIVLGPGTWDITYDVNVILKDNSGAQNVLRANVAIFDGSNNVEPDSISYHKLVLGANDLEGTSLSGGAEVTITSETTYKLRVRSDQGSANGVVTVVDDTIEVSLTDPDGGSIIRAERHQ